MSEEPAFWRSGDTSLQDKLKAAASPEAALQIAKDAGFSITAEDIQSMQSATVEVSDKELESAQRVGMPVAAISNELQQTATCYLGGSIVLTVVRGFFPTPPKPLH